MLIARRYEQFATLVLPLFLYLRLFPLPAAGVTFEFRDRLIRARFRNDFRDRIGL